MATYFCFETQQRLSGLPPPTHALREPNGLLAMGGDLAPATLLTAYRCGVFPWYGPEQPILWWSPDPRAILYPNQLHVSRSLRRFLHRLSWEITVDRDFKSVLGACAAPRRDHTGTWITPEMASAYQTLHALGHAHSVECWAHDTLVGGVYGVAVGQVFFAESMFSRAPNGSKVALVALCRSLHAWGYQMIDCQIPNPHLQSLGVQVIPRREFQTILGATCEQPPAAEAWKTARLVAPLA